VRAAALVIFAFGMGLSVWAILVNRFFSSVVRIQTERGHRVIDTGPYRLVRHPGYLGLLLAAVAGGIVLGSLWSLLPLVLLIALFVRRLLIEDAMLQSDLDGYVDYTHRVRHKLLPGLW
jgi:protein-S-isoprenylcysteine O-methyltransferase Ste14